MRLVALALLGLTLAGCKTSEPADYTLLHAHQTPSTMAAHMAERVGACWFDGNHPAFAEYSYAPELSSPKRPRVLLVQKSDPAGLPKLVIEVEGAKRGSDIRLFGPLMGSAESSKIYRDISRWAGGARDC